MAERLVQERPNDFDEEPARQFQPGDERRSHTLDCFTAGRSDVSERIEEILAAEVAR